MVHFWFIPTKLGKDIAWGKGHLVREYDLDFGNGGHFNLI